jgi:hypothetical protein
MVIRQSGSKCHVLLGGVRMVVVVSVEDHTGWIKGGGLDTFVIVIPPCVTHFLHV